VPEIIIGTPGRLNEQFNAGNLPLGEVEVLVLDEADRMLDMGFSEDVLKLAGPARPSARPCCSPPPAAVACARWSPRSCANRSTCSSTASAS
jgi:superfamily II DNA/RNA helicase